MVHIPRLISIVNKLLTLRTKKDSVTMEYTVTNHPCVPPTHARTHTWFLEFPIYLKQKQVEKVTENKLIDVFFLLFVPFGLLLATFLSCLPEELCSFTES